MLLDLRRMHVPMLLVLSTTNVTARHSPLPYYALSNLLTLFSHDMPTLPLIQHVFDYLLCRPPIITVYLAAAVRHIHPHMGLDARLMLILRLGDPHA